jgi:peptidoglycan/LPS O-acetylase OafA/YrhL
MFASSLSDKENNFNLLRMVAAMSVLITHSFALALGDPAAEPLRASLGMTMGNIAVDVFFVASGFLVAGSLLRTQNAWDFILARGLRIFPGLLVAVTLTVLVCGCFFSLLPMGEYFTHRQTWSYMLWCLTLFRGIAYQLPGVFTANPIPQAVNGSLWSLQFEVWMYAALVLLWMLFKWTRAERAKLFMGAVLIWALLSWALLVQKTWAGAPVSEAINLSAMFSSGAAWRIWRDHVPLSRRFFYVTLVIMFVCVGHPEFFRWGYLLSITHTVLYLAFVPSALGRKYAAIQDYSYGVYIYAFPIQQAVAATHPGISVVSMVAWSMLMTLLAAMASWHFVEKPGLQLKSRWKLKNKLV